MRKAKSTRATDPDGAPLRQQATELIQRQGAGPRGRPDLSPSELIHELQIHQAELEMQNAELREAQVSLETARDRYFTLFDLSPALYLVFDREHCLQEVNLAATELLGLQRAQVAGRPFALLVAAERRQAFHEHLNEVFRTGARMRVEIQVVPRGSSPRHLYLESQLLPAQENVPVRCLSTGFDITQRQAAEEALRESELRFRTLAESAPAMIWMTGPDKLATFFNRSWLAFTGADLGYAQGRGWLESIHPADRTRFWEAYAAAFESRESFTLEHRLLRFDGEYRWVQNSGAPRFDSRGIIAGFIGNAVDITERKNAEAEGLELERRVQTTHRLESLGVLAGGIAHDFNNLLVAIMGNAELAGIDLDPHHPARRYVDEVLKASHHAQDVVRQIFAFSRQPPGGRRPVSLQAVILEGLKLLRPSLPPEVEIFTELDPGVRPVLADAAKIHQVIINLVNNAVDAMAGRAGRIEVSVREVSPPSLQVQRVVNLVEGRCARLVVRDAGCGMPPEIVERIFDPFFTTKTPSRGTGLGLAVVHGIIQSHGGVVQVESQPDRGTILEIFLPLAPDLPPQAAPAPEPTRTAGSRLRIMLVDDEPAVVSVCQMLLERLGCAVTAFHDPREALAAFRARPRDYDLVLTDKTMPFLNGVQLAASILGERADTPIIMATGYDDEEAAAEARAVGVRRVLGKPFRQAALSEALEVALETGGTRS